jgi:hypothetical protein
LAKAIQEGEAIAISDGSFQDQYGTAAWALEGSGSKGRIVGAVTVPGTAKDQSAYRSELAGLYCILLGAKKLCEFFNITQGSIELGCNGQSALDKAFNYVSIIKIEDSNYDLLFAIRNLWAYSPLTWKFRHVKGHQDDHSPHEKLDRWAKLNVEMDKRAKQHMEIAKRSPRHFMIAAEPWSIWYHGKKIMSDLTETLYDLVHSDEAKEYWKRKDNLSDTDIDSVNWDLIGVAMKETKRSQRIFISKHSSGMCGVGKFMKRWQQRHDDSCPRCGMQEDSAHVWLCKGEGVDEIWDKAILEVERWLTKVQTDPDIKHAILAHLNSWRTGHPLDSPNPFLLEEILLGQSRVGWRRFFEGWLIREWTMAQQAYYKISKSLRSGRRWTVELIKKLWDVAWDLWEHRNSILHRVQNVVTDKSSRSLNQQV